MDVSEVLPVLGLGAPTGIHTEGRDGDVALYRGRRSRQKIRSLT
jgi:hypothetical protein